MNSYVMFLFMLITIIVASSCISTQPPRHTDDIEERMNEVQFAGLTYCAESFLTERFMSSNIDTNIIIEMIDIAQVSLILANGKYLLENFDLGERTDLSSTLKKSLRRKKDYNMRDLLNDTTLTYLVEYDLRITNDTFSDTLQVACPLHWSSDNDNFVTK